MKAPTLLLTASLLLLCSCHHGAAPEEREHEEEYCPPGHTETPADIFTTLLADEKLLADLEPRYAGEALTLRQSVPGVLVSWGEDAAAEVVYADIDGTDRAVWRCDLFGADSLAAGPSLTVGGTDIAIKSAKMLKRTSAVVLVAAVDETDGVHIVCVPI